MTSQKLRSILDEAFRRMKIKKVHRNELICIIEQYAATPTEKEWVVDNLINALIDAKVDYHD